MKSLNIKGTEKTPTVNFNPETGKLELRGRSLPENAPHFYDPIIQWVKEYTLHPLPQTELEIKIDYFNSSSSKSIFTLMKAFEIVDLNKNQVTVNWYCNEDDEEMMEIFYAFNSLIQLPLKMEIIA